MNIKDTVVTILSTGLALAMCSVASANSITSDSKVWEKDLSVELGYDYRNFNIPVTRTRDVPAVLEHGRIVTPARHERYTVIKNISNSSGNVRATKLIGSDAALSVGYNGKGYGSATLRNGALTGQLGLTTEGNYFATATVSPFKNVAMVYHNQRNVSAIGAQVQLGNFSVLGSHNMAAGGGYSIGLGYEFGSNPAAPAPTLALTLPAASAAPAPAPCRNGEVKLNTSNGFNCITVIKGRG